MDTDRVIHFESRPFATAVWWAGQMPSRDDVGTLIEDYLGEVMRSRAWGGGRWTVSLTGPCSYPLQRLEPDRTPSKGAARPRWLEVYIGPCHVNVITRSQDDLVMVIADGLAKLIARYWKGQLES